MLRLVAFFALCCAACATPREPWSPPREAAVLEEQQRVAAVLEQLEAPALASVPPPSLEGLPPEAILALLEYLEGYPFPQCPPPPDPRRDPLRMSSAWPIEEGELRVGGVWWLDATEPGPNDRVELRACHKHPGQTDAEGVCSDPATVQLLPEPPSGALFLGGFVLLSWLSWRRRPSVPSGAKA